MSYQKISNNHFGLAFSKDKFEKSIHVGLSFSKNNVGKSTHVYENNHNPYNSFVKRNTDTISKRIKNKYIWIPKNLSIMDKNSYIASHTHTHTHTSCM